VWIYHTPGSGYDGWTIAYREPGVGRKRVFRASLAAARTEAEAIATRLANVQAVLTGPDAVEASQARQLAEELGTTLLAAMREHSDIVKLLGSRATPLKAVQYYLEHHDEVLATMTLMQIKDEFLRHLEQDGAGDRHLSDMRNRLALFTGHFLLPPARLTSILIEDWLRSEQKKNNWTGRTRNHYRAAVSNLLSFAKRRGYLARDWLEMDFVQKATEEDQEIGIYSPNELKKILDQKPSADLLPFVVLSAFADTRPSEVCRLRWEDFHFDTGELFIGAGKVRTAGHRVAPILPNCAAWLAPVRKASGPVSSLTDFSHPLAELLLAAGVAPVHDGLRHSFISYRRMLTKNLSQVSGETGTDPVTLTKRYCRPVPQADALAWFALAPV
jgi:integrase